MPSETAVFNRTLTNLGPLTTTFTPAPSCTALGRQSDAGYIFWHRDFHGAGPANGEHIPYGSVACTPQDLATCYPNGAARQSILASGYEFTQPYNSPGYHCPAGWTAVGSATYEAAWSALSAWAENGAPPPKGYGAVVTAFAISALAPSETVTVCCPSGYEPFAGDFEAQFGCTSSLGPASSYSISERCFNDRPTTTATFYYWNGGQPVTKIEPVSDAPTKYTQLPLETGTDMSYEVFHTMPNVVLINKGDAGEAASPTATATGTGKDDDKDGKKNVASARRADVSLATTVTILVTSASFLGVV